MVDTTRDANTPQPLLRRSRRDRMVFGVCGGLGEYFGVDPLLVRLAFILVSLAGGSGILAYLLLAVVLPDERRAPTAGRDGLRHNLADLQSEAGDLADEVRGGFGAPADGVRRLARGPQLAGVLLLGLGLVFLLGNLGWLSWFHWGVFWPLLLVALGAVVLLRRGPDA